MQDEAQLIDQVAQSGYKILKKETVVDKIAAKPTEDDEEKLRDNYLSEIEKQTIEKRTREESEDLDPKSMDSCSAFFSLVAIKMM